MTSAWQQGFAHLFQAIDRHPSRVQELSERLKAVSGKATGHRGMVTVTVGAAGEVTEVKFDNRNYTRMAPKELGKIVLETIEKARAAAAEAVREARGAVALPDGLSVEDFRAGKSDLNALMSSLDSALLKDVAEFLDGTQESNSTKDRK